jgi:ribonuclease E
VALREEGVAPPPAFVDTIPLGEPGAEGERDGRRRRRRGGRDRAEGRVDEAGNVQGPVAGAVDGAAAEDSTAAMPRAEAGDSQPPEGGAPEAAVREGGEREGRGRRRGGRGRREPRDGAPLLEGQSADEGGVRDDAALAPLAAVPSAAIAADYVDEDEAPAPTPRAAEVAVEAGSEAAAPAAPVVAAAQAPVAAAATVAEAAAAPVPVPAPPVAPRPVVEPYTLPVEALRSMAATSGLEWVNSDAEKIRVVQEAMASTPAPVRVPRTPRAQVVVDDGPLVLVETRKDLSQMKLPFEQVAR